MNTPDSYCVEFLRKNDRERYLSVLFAPQQKRNGLAALYAFNVEIARIRESVREPLVGEIRLRWWRDAISGDQTQDGEGHPVLHALLQVINQYNLPKAAFLRYCDARMFDLYNDPMPDTHALEAYCGETASAILQLACQILDQDAAHHAVDASGHGGVTQAITGLLRLLPFTQMRGQMYLPADIIRAVGANPQDLSSSQGNGEEKARVVTAVTALAQEHYAIFRLNYAELPKSLKTAYLPLAIIPAILKRMEKVGAEAFIESIHLSPLQQLWLLTKAAVSGKMPKGS